MELRYDFHLHSCLSPCAESEMTPGNIAGMAHLLGLQTIALTDHNTVRNCPSLIAQAAPYGITVIPGMELTTAEEIHVLCLFEELPDALAWDAYVYEHLQKVRNREDIFGRQILVDEADVPCGQEENLLLNATDISFDSVGELVASLRGLMIPAHLDRASNSLLASFGAVPPGAAFPCFELRDLRNLPPILEEHPDLRKRRVITCSDAHALCEMREEAGVIRAKENTPGDILRALRGE